MFDYSQTMHEFISDYVEEVMDHATKSAFSDLLKSDLTLQTYVNDVRRSRNLLKKMAPALQARLRMKELKTIA